MQEEETGISPAPSPPTRWELLRDVAVFQVKLIFDGLRDLFLSPLSLIATLIGLIVGGHNPGRFFYALLHLGKRTENWISLFSAADHDPQANPNAPPLKTERAENIDQVVNHLEGFARTRYEKDGWLAGTKHTIDRGIDWINDHIKRLTSKGGP